MVPPEVISSYGRILKQLDSKSFLLQRYQIEAFDHQEFQQYLKIKKAIAQGVGRYRGLSRNMALVEAAMTVAEKLLLIAETEMQYRGSAQQSFYRYVARVLAQGDPKKIRKVFQRKIQVSLRKIKTDRGRRVLSNYAQAVASVSENRMGLELLEAFKQNHTESYLVLRTVSDLAKKIRKSETTDFAQLKIQVQLHWEVFDSLTEILGFSFSSNAIDSYALMLQYIALKKRHQKSEQEFRQMLKYLDAWEQVYLKLAYILNDYFQPGYITPPLFKQEIPGLDLYRQHKQHLVEYQKQQRRTQKVRPEHKPRLFPLPPQDTVDGLNYCLVPSH